MGMPSELVSSSMRPVYRGGGGEMTILSSSNKHFNIIFTAFWLLRFVSKYIMLLVVFL